MHIACNKYGRQFLHKKTLVRAVEQGESITLLAATSWHREYEGPLSEAPDGDYYIEIPDPAIRRRVVPYSFACLKKVGESVSIQ